MGQPAVRHGTASWSEVSRARRRTQGTEPSQYLKEEKSTEIPLVAASETGGAHPESSYGFHLGSCGVWKYFLYVASV